MLFLNKVRKRQSQRKHLREVCWLWQQGGRVLLRGCCRKKGSECILCMLNYSDSDCKLEHFQRASSYLSGESVRYGNDSTALLFLATH